MFESQELVATNLLFEFVANEMQLFFDLLHIFFQDSNVFFQYGDIFFQFADCFERFVALLANGLKPFAEYFEIGCGGLPGRRYIGTGFPLI
jgi:hypothetical protein